MPRRRRSPRARSLRPGLESLELRRLLVVRFDEVSLYPVSSAPRGITLADLDGDRALDVAYAIPAENRVGVRLGRGDGTFGPEIPLSVGAFPVDVAAADFDGDGSADLAVSCRDGDRIEVHPGRGDGTFGAPAGYTGGHQPRRIAIADMDGDLHQDLVVGYESRDVAVFHGQADGRFDLQAMIPMDDSCNGIAVGARDRDGRRDIVVAGDAAVYRLSQDRTGNFTKSRAYSTRGRGGNAVSLAELNFDGQIDAVVASSGSNFVSVLPNDWSGGFETAWIYPVSDTPPGAATGSPSAWTVSAIDLDHDIGIRPELIIGTSDGIVIRPGLENGTYPIRYDGFSPHDVQAVAVGDVDGDGWADLVSTSTTQPSVWLLRNASGDPPSDVALAPLGGPVLEGDSGEERVKVTVTMSPRSNLAVTFRYATSGGTAVPGVDYTPVQGTLTIPAGAVSAEFFVPVRGNLRVDGTRTIGLALSSPQGPATLDPYHTTATLTIADNEVPSTFQFRESAVVVDPSSGVATVTVVRDDDRSEGVTVAYATAGGTAVAGSDYTGIGGTLRFAAGQRSQTVQIPLLDNAWWSAGKTIGVRLSEPRGGQVGSIGQTTVTIQQPAPVLVRSAVPRAGVDGKLTEVVLTFSGPLDARSARTLGQYKLVTAGRDGVLGTRDDKAVGLRVAYQAGTRQVTLSVPASGRRVGPYRLTVGPKLLDARRRAVDGDANGQAGGTFAAVLRT